MESVVYHSPLKLTAKQRLARTLSGLVWQLQQQRPGLAETELRMWIGLSLCRNRTALIKEAESRL